MTKILEVFLRESFRSVNVGTVMVSDTFSRADQTNASIIHHIIHSKLRGLGSMNGTPSPSDSSSFGHHTSSHIYLFTLALVLVGECFNVVEYVKGVD